jgi:alpha-ribazole phosphatase
MALILLRHTRPEGAQGLCYGRTDLGLAAGFDDEAARLATELPQTHRVITSPLSRCASLARHIASVRGLPLLTDPRLMEMDFGTWEGRHWAEIPRPELDAWADDLTGARPHGGETVAELAERAAAALSDAARGPVPALIVTHAGVIKAALAARQGPQGWHAQIGFGAWLVLPLDGGG